MDTTTTSQDPTDEEVLEMLTAKRNRALIVLDAIDGAIAEIEQEPSSPAGATDPAHLATVERDASSSATAPDPAPAQGDGCVAGIPSTVPPWLDLDGLVPPVLRFRLEKAASDLEDALPEFCEILDVIAGMHEAWADEMDGKGADFLYEEPVRSLTGWGRFENLCRLMVDALTEASKPHDCRSEHLARTLAEVDITAIDRMQDRHVAALEHLVEGASR